MSSTPPDYFEAIRANAQKRWNTLASDPDIAGPWKLLFKQVQSPRHVLSELMQNADDVGATTAIVSLEDGYFSFMHDGEDFTETHFQSICRFGYSNKRELHTIGFRGIGFKSVFSLGSEIHLLTPTLSVTFNADKFTLPVWNQEVPRRQGWTEIRIKVTDRLRFEEFRKNLEEWLKTGFSLLFFRNIRSLKIATREITWVERANGPVPNSKWMTVRASDKAGFLLARSEKLAFPPECQDEIRKERQVFESDQIQMPPCSVEIIAGAKGRLHVIVPTSVETDLPFTINAPFVQDPARIQIKELELSPTNRWLLEQVGVLAANLILDWVCHSTDSVEKRSQAYSLLPVNNQEDLDNLPVRVLRMVDQELTRQLEGKNFLLDVQGLVHSSGKCFTVDSVIQNVWPSAMVTATFGPEGAHLLNNAVRNADRLTLAAKGYVTIVSKEDVLERLRTGGVPKPQTFSRLLRLWNHLTPELSSGPHSTMRADVHILPVLNDNSMACASDTLRVHRTDELRNSSDWDFFGRHLKILDSDWVDYLNTSIDPSDSAEEGNLLEQRKAAIKLMEILGLANHVGLPRVISNMAKKLKEDPRNQLENCVRLTHIAACVEAVLPEQFPFFNRFGGACTAEKMIRDQDGFIEQHSPEQWARTLLLHPSYFTPNSSCTQEELSEWIKGPISGFLPFPLPQALRRELDGRDALKNVLEVRGYKGRVVDHYHRQLFELADWDYPPEAWACWDDHAARNPEFWDQWMRRFLSLGSENLKKVKVVKAWQIATTIKKKEVIDGSLLPAWVIQLRQRRCLIDTNGNLEMPEKLMVRTPAAKVFEGHLRFVSAEIDTESNRPFLEMVGAKGICDDPEYFLHCLRALAQASIPPLDEVVRLYRMLDAVIPHLGAKRQILVDVFKQENLVHTALGEWVTSEDQRAWIGEEANVPTEARKLKLWSVLRPPAHTTGVTIVDPPQPISSGELIKNLNEASRKFGIRPQVLIELGEEAARNLPDSRKKPEGKELEPFPFRAFVKLPRWVLELFPSGCAFQKLTWPDGSANIQLLDEDGKTLLAKHIPAEEPEPNDMETHEENGANEGSSLGPSWDDFMKNLTKDLE